MPRPTTIQITIFSTVAFVISLILNVFLFTENNQRQKDLTSAHQQVMEIEQQQQQNQLTATEKVNVMQSTQRELSDITIEFQTTLSELKKDYNELQTTAKLNAENLSKAATQANRLKKELTFTQIKLAESQATITNLERTLRNHTAQSLTLSEFDAFQISQLSNQLLLVDPNKEIGVVQKNDGSLLISIPLGQLFLPSSDQLSPNAKLVLTPVAERLNSRQKANVTIIGHSDERLITSELVNKYPSNWELSASRASKVVRTLIDLGVNPNYLMAAGKAATEPVRDASAEAAWQINRRIDILIE